MRRSNASAVPRGHEHSRDPPTKNRSSEKRATCPVEVQLHHCRQLNALLDRAFVRKGLGLRPNAWSRNHLRIRMTVAGPDAPKRIERADVDGLVPSARASRLHGSLLDANSKRPTGHHDPDRSAIARDLDGDELARFA